MLLPCYHTFCLSCVGKITKCPLDYLGFEQCGQNYELLEYVMGESRCGGEGRIEEEEGVEEGNMKEEEDRGLEN